MANKTPTKTAFSKVNQPKKKPGKGKTERTKILESFKREAKTENEFYDLLTTKAFNPDDNFAFMELLKRLSPIPKSVSPLFKFDLPKGKNVTPHKQAEFVIQAISKGVIPSDIGVDIIRSITNMLKIKEVTDIEDRLKRMESQIESPE